jgi:hypothetical protein
MVKNDVLVKLDNTYIRIQYKGGGRKPLKSLLYFQNTTGWTR